MILLRIGVHCPLKTLLTIIYRVFTLICGLDTRLWESRHQDCCLKFLFVTEKWLTRWPGDYSKLQSPPSSLDPQSCAAFATAADLLSISACLPCLRVALLTCPVLLPYLPIALLCVPGGTSSTVPWGGGGGGGAPPPPPPTAPFCVSPAAFSSFLGFPFLLLLRCLDSFLTLCCFFFSSLCLFICFWLFVFFFCVLFSVYWCFFLE